MATVAGSTKHGKTFSLEGLTYPQAANKVFRNLAAWDTQFTALKTALEKTPTEIQEIALVHITNKDLSALTSQLNQSYEYYRIVLEQRAAALDVLNTLDEQFQEAIEYCTPKDVSLRPEQLEDMTKHGYDLKFYPNKELALVESSAALLTESRKIQAVLQKIQVFITTCPHAMNGAARAVKQASRDTTWGDWLPEKLVGETRYFMEGFAAFQKQNPRTQAENTEQTNKALDRTENSEETSTPTTPSSSDVLETLTKLIDGEKH